MLGGDHVNERKFVELETYVSQQHSARLVGVGSLTHGSSYVGHAVHNTRGPSPEMEQHRWFTRSCIAPIIDESTETWWRHTPDSAGNQRAS
jgi:hypothetical protein